MTNREGFPLQWPDNLERSATTVRAPFKTSLEAARKAILKEVRLLKGAGNPVITTNIPLKKDGQLYATGQPVGGELAVAVYFTWDDTEYVIACDNYDRIQDNVSAAARIIKAIRDIARWGNKSTIARTLEGSRAQLPQHAGQSTFGAWWQVLGVPRDASPLEIEEAYRLKKIYYHPDKPTGNHDMFTLIGNAYDQAKKAGRV